MPKYKLKWMIELEKIVEAKDITEAEEQAFDMDCQHTGEYVKDSFEILSLQKI